MKIRENYIEQYKRMVRFLGMALGDNYEVVLHILSDEGFYIGEIINNHISGRDEGAPLTNLALEKIRQEHYRDHEYIINYKVSVKNNKTINGSTFYVKDDDGELIGLLCINADYSKYKSIAQEVLHLMNIKAENLLEDDKEPTQNGNFVEVLSNDIEEVISDIIDPELLDDRVTLSKEARLDIVRQLDQKGVFQLKGSIGKVADLLKVSEPSVYRYLQEVNKTNDVE